jgi:hypothetical protein
MERGASKKFEGFKKLNSSAHVIRFSNFTKPFEVHYDASNFIID